jgi:8-oxo-dGTP pyrophosphatase MutT (NUDIX family)
VSGAGQEGTGTSSNHVRGTLADDVLIALGNWSPQDDDAVLRKMAAVQFVTQHGVNAVDRENRLGHVTASTVVLDATRQRVLLTLHPLIGHWVQLGGHLEPGDVNLASAALREAIEESGFDGMTLDPVPIGVDRHAVVCRDGQRQPSPSQHFDVTFVAVADEGVVIDRSEESLDLRWFDIEDLPIASDSTTLRLIRAARDRDRATSPPAEPAAQRFPNFP